MNSSAPRRLFDRTARRCGLEPDEARTLSRMAALMAILMCAYTLAKVLRDALFLGEFGALRLPVAYVAVACASAAWVWLEDRVGRALPRLGGPRFAQSVAVGASLLAAVGLPRAPRLTTALFYVWTGSQAMVLLPHFWALALDIWNSRRARRLFPVLGGCGLVGGLAGGGLAAWSATRLGHATLCGVLSGLLAVAWALTASIERHRALAAGPAAPVSRESLGRIIRRSRYIRTLAAALCLSVITATFIDFQFKVFLQAAYPDPRDLTRFLGVFYAGLNAVALLLQFGAAGWLLEWLGLGASTLLQPGAILALAASATASAGGWAIVALRWIQGVVSQTLGKPATEIYYAAVRAGERRRIKPALDMLIERWSDAVVGLALMVAIHFLGVPMSGFFAATAVLAAAWLAALLVLHREHGHVLQEALDHRWIDPWIPPESMRLPAARRALLRALDTGDERRVTLALALCPRAQDAAIGRAVRRSLRHPSPRVRVAAVEAMEAMRLADPAGVVEGFLDGSDETLRRAAITYLLSRRPAPLPACRRILDGDDGTLKDDLLDALADHPDLARRLLSGTRIRDRLASSALGDRLLAARALGALRDPETAAPLKTLLGDPDPGVRRAALASAGRRPGGELLAALLPLLADAADGDEALDAVAAIGDPAVPALGACLAGARGERSRARAAGALARIATPRALEALGSLIRSGDVRLRHLGLQGMARVRARIGRPVLPRAMAHRLFLREIRDHRLCREPADGLSASTVPDLRLFGQSWRESADRALERAIHALACWYEPGPLEGVLDRLRSSGRADAGAALEHLGHVLPRSVFLPAGRILDPGTIVPPGAHDDPDRLAAWIGLAWDTGDSWLRACAVRAARHAPSFDRRRFEDRDPEDALVGAEIAALARYAPGPRGEARAC